MKAILYIKVALTLLSADVTPGTGSVREAWQLPTEDHLCLNTKIHLRGNIPIYNLGGCLMQQIKMQRELQIKPASSQSGFAVVQRYPEGCLALQSGGT